VALAPLLQELQGLISPLATRSSIHLNVVDSGSIAVQADRQRLRQVLLNLLSNAIKFNHAGGSVQLSAMRDMEQVRISVTDTGIGIAPGQIERLFSPFERLDAEKRGVEGTGLGLAISHQLMKRMQGSIEVQSEPGRGSTFTLVLAGADASLDADTQVTAAQTGIPAEPREPARHVLYIEDNGPNIALMKAVMNRRPHWRLEVAHSGTEGLARVRAQPPDLLLLDLHLPDMSGEAVLQALRDAPSVHDMPFAILSADALPATVARLRASGAADYLTKPLEVPRLFALLDRYES
jgi:CheY-like chemotaxis protein/anti-sigma regulatory factor (Ser/Thr protein kinase)